MDPSWHWFEHQIKQSDLFWSHYSSQPYQRQVRFPILGPTIWRLFVANKAVSSAMESKRVLLVSHGPRPAYYASRIAQIRNCTNFPHLAFSFNFTCLPEGIKRKEMSRAYRSVDRFTVFSTMEKGLYSNYFDINPSRIDMVHWGVNPVTATTLPPSNIKHRYVSAVGTQGRDYKVLMEVARRLSGVPFHLVVHPESIKSLTIPENVTVHTSIPYNEAASIVAHSDFMVLPLLHGNVPCGHVTCVMAMHLGRAIVATNSIGLHDYLQHGTNAYLVEPDDPMALSESILSLWDDPPTVCIFGERAQDFAQRFCSEVNVLKYFNKYLAERMGCNDLVEALL